MIYYLNKKNNRWYIIILTQIQKMKIMDIKKSLIESIDIMLFLLALNGFFVFSYILLSYLLFL